MNLLMPPTIGGSERSLNVFLEKIPEGRRYMGPQGPALFLECEIQFIQRHQMRVEILPLSFSA